MLCMFEYVGLVSAWVFKLKASAKLTTSNIIQWIGPVQIFNCWNCQISVKIILIILSSRLKLALVLALLTKISIINYPGSSPIHPVIQAPNNCYVNWLVNWQWLKLAHFLHEKAKPMKFGFKKQQSQSWQHQIEKFIHKKSSENYE